MNIRMVIEDRLQRMAEKVQPLFKAGWAHHEGIAFASQDRIYQSMVHELVASPAPQSLD